MALSLSNTLATPEPRTALTAAELEVELEATRQREAEAAELAAEQARQAEARRLQAERHGRAQLETLEAELTATLERADQTRPTARLRGLARMFLYGAPEGAGTELLVDLADQDPGCGALHDLHQRAGRTMQTLSDAGATDAYDHADTLECRAWSALMARIRWLAGEG